jgi:hypothetical protein
LCYMNSVGVSCFCDGALLISADSSSFVILRSFLRLFRSGLKACHL